MHMANGRAPCAPFYPNGRATAISVTGHIFFRDYTRTRHIGPAFQETEHLFPAFNQPDENEQADFSTCPYSN